MTIGRTTRLRLYAAAALLTAALALSPPLDALSDSSFAWHMVEHVLLLFVAPLFVLLAHPLEWFGPPRARWQIVTIRVLRGAPARALCSPVCCLFLFIAVLWGSHFTPLYEAALDHPLVHAGEHALYAFAGTAFWLPIVAPPPFYAPPYPLRVLYLFLALPQGALLAVALLAARAPLYAHYAGVGALADQHNAAAVMWVGGGGIVFAAVLVTLARWAAREHVPVTDRTVGRGQYRAAGTR